MLKTNNGINMLNERELKNFLEKINKIDRGYVDENDERSECWEWTAGLSNTGYGKVNLRRFGGTKSCHRVSLAHFKSFDIDSDKYALHKCDNHKCCNPEHLFEGTHQENMDDMKSKDRCGDRPASVGARNGNSKLTEIEVAKIVSLLPRLNNKEIAAELDNAITHSMVSRIRLGKSWSHYTKIIR